MYVQQALKFRMQRRSTVSSTPSAPYTATVTSTTTNGAEDPMRQLEKSLFQIFSAHGCLRDTDLEVLITPLKAELGILGNVNVKMIFQNMNKRLRDLSLEIRTVVIRPPSTSNPNSSSNRANDDVLYYHGLANIEEDFVAKEHGSAFNPEELYFFTSICTMLLSVRTLSTDDIIPLKPDKWHLNTFHCTLNRLIEYGWLERNDRSYVTIAARTYLELNSYLEDVLIQSDELDEIENEEQRRARLIHDKLPQILMY
jgi:hypothetical protein